MIIKRQSPIMPRATVIGGQDFVAIAGPSGEIFTLSGTITGAVVEGVRVDLEGVVQMTTETDNAGVFSFADVPSGTYVIVPSLEGYNFSPPFRVITLPIPPPQEP